MSAGRDITSPAELPARMRAKITEELCPVAGLDGEQELAEDVLEIVTVFSARLYGARSHKNKKLIDGVQKAVTGDVQGA